MYPAVPRIIPGLLASAVVSSEAEVEELDAPVRGDERVRGLDVAMPDALGVGGTEGLRHLDPVVERLAVRQGATVHPITQ